jgi:phosphoribosyl-dephospho-CoA transferase
MIPVGIRGMERSQRFAAWLDPRGIGYVMAPETLRATDEVRAMPVFAALRELERRMSSSPYPWGPTGSTGFELASGTPMVNPASDLDILLRSKTRLSHQDAQSIMDRCVDLTCAVDIQIETPHGAFALREFLNGDGRVLLRACGGPILVDDPWQLPALCKQLPAVCKMSA